MRVIIFLIVFILKASLVIQAQQVNDKVKIEYKGTWYDGKILKVNETEDTYYIKYDGCDDSWNEWVGIRRLRDHKGRSMLDDPAVKLKHKQISINTLAYSVMQLEEGTEERQYVLDQLIKASPEWFGVLDKKLLDNKMILTILRIMKREYAERFILISMEKKVAEAKESYEEASNELIELTLERGHLVAILRDKEIITEAEAVEILSDNISKQTRDKLIAYANTFEKSAVLTKYKVGDKVELEYGTILEPATIIEIDGNKYHIEFDKKVLGDKWVSEEQIKLKH